MNKLGSIIIIFLVGKIVIAQAQNPSFSVGGRLGVNISNLSDNYSGGESAIGLNAGAVGVMNFGKFGYTSLVTELMFNQKGGKNTASGSNTINNIDIPLLLRYSKSVKEGSQLKYFANLGPYVGMMLSRSVNPDSGSYAKDFKGSFGELGFCIGGGFMYPLGPGNLFIEGRYAFSITNVVPKSFERNQLTSISIGYLYTISKPVSQEHKDKKIDMGFE